MRKKCGYPVIKHVLAWVKDQSKRSKNNKSFKKLAQSVNDQQMTIKLLFFKEIAHIKWIFKTIPNGWSYGAPFYLMHMMIVWGDLWKCLSSSQ